MLSKKRLCSVILGVLFVAVFAAQLPAAQLEITEDTVTNELRALSQSIDKLVDQLEKHPGAADTDLRKLEIAIAYLNFRSRRIEMFERELQSTRNTRNRLTGVLEQLQMEEDSLSKSADSNQQGGLERAREELDFRRQIVKDRISRIDEEIIMQENRIMDMQSQIDSVESFVEKNLAF